MRIIAFLVGIVLERGIETNLPGKDAKYTTQVSIRVQPLSAIANGRSTAIDFAG